jgi:small multidrug resistance pump
MNPILALLLAIASEVVGTTALKASEGFTKPLPIVLVTLGYAASFYFLSQALKAGMLVGPAYAIWSGIGTAAIALIGILLFGEKLTVAELIGIGLIIAGVVVVNAAGASATRTV